MADDFDMDSDASAGIKRTVTNDTHSSLQQQDLKESSIPIQESMETTKDHLEFCNNLTEENKELGFVENQESELVKEFGVPVEEKCQEVKGSMKLEVGLSGIQDSIVEGDGKESMGTETLLVAEKKRLLAHVDKVLNDGETVDGIKLVDGDFRCPVKIQVVDDTALIESVQVPRNGNGCLKDMGIAGAAKMMDRNLRKQVDVKKAKRSKKKAKEAKIVSGMSARLVVQNKGRLNNGEQEKIMYSREEMESLRFVNVAQQRKLWRDICAGLGPAVVNEYGNLTSSKHQKKILKSFDPQMCFSSKSEAPGILGKEYSESMENVTEYTENYEAENMSTIDSACKLSTEGEACPVLEGDCSEDYDSDEEYASIQRPAFLVKGEPNFDSGPPEDGLEYLRRVRWEAAHIPKVKVAKCGGQKINKEQTVYMPEIPDIAQCPDHLLPLKQWEDQFLADFSELRVVLSGLENSSAQPTGKLQPTVTVHNKSDSFQSPADVLIENFNDLRTGESISESDQPVDGFCVKSSVELPSISNTRDDQNSPSHQNLKSSLRDDSGDYPALSAILRMDSVARVSTLRKRINSVEISSNLSRNDCLWLFALCAAVDSPLDADTCAALRSLLRKCAALRAGKSELDDEVVMLNILATISGKYFGQSEV